MGQPTMVLPIVAVGDPSLNTVGMPVAIIPTWQPTAISPIRAAGDPSTKTLPAPVAITPTQGTHGGSLWQQHVPTAMSPILDIPGIFIPNYNLVLW